MSETRIGIFGGTFDPVHQTHLDTARCARDRFRLDEVLFVPAPEPPHKKPPAATFAERCAMVERALATEPDCGRLACSRLEDDLPRPSYTIHTARAVMARRAPAEQAARFYLVIGMDSLEMLPQWHEAEALLGLIDLLVLNRGRVAADAVREHVRRLRPEYEQTADGVWRNSAGRTLEIADDFDSPYSSTAIRAALARGETPEGPPPSGTTSGNTASTVKTARPETVPGRALYCEGTRRVMRLPPPPGVRWRAAARSCPAACSKTSRCRQACHRAA